MATQTIDATRIRRLNGLEPRRSGRADYVLYWMQQSQRAEFNYALEYAAQQANEAGKPLVVGFGLTDAYPQANARHYRFMLEGLSETAGALRRRRIAFVLRRGSPDAVALELARRAVLVVTDRAYLRTPKAWRRRVAEEAGCRVVEVESDVVVPVNEVSDKAEHAARTIRPKIMKRLNDYLVELRTTPVRRDATGLELGAEDVSDPGALLDRLDVDRSVPPVPELFQGGTSQARAVFRRFLTDRFKRYAEHRNQPQTDDVSHMSKYLHFGQVSPVALALEARSTPYGHAEDREAFIEELVVRRELACNFTEFTPDYDRYTCIPGWAKRTLDEHRADRREHTYTRQQLEGAQTHDPYWNAAMREMRYTGYMHNYMRMYWGKKILEWYDAPDAAFRTTLALNNKYFIDGRDPNSFTGVAWCYGVHDRAWTERAVLGKIRYMNASGLRRKADPDAYVEKVDRLVAEVGGPAGGGGGGRLF